MHVKQAALVCLALVLLSIGSQAQRLGSPWDGVKIVATDAPYSCPAAPAFAKTLNAEGYYTDKKYSVIDPTKLAEFNKATEGPTHLGQYASKAADAWLENGSRAAAACAYALLAAAADADAWDGKMPQNNGAYLQNWMLSGSAIAYLKVRNSGGGTPEQDAKIQKWFGAVGARVREYFDVQRTRPGSDAWNNHMYWAGLAVGAQGIACNDENAFLWGMLAYHAGVMSVQPDGSLVAEMNRAGMAEHYQLYALDALVMLAELASANGMNVYTENDGAIHRLAKFSAEGLENPSMIEKRTGVPQNLPETIAGLEIGWAVPYAKRFPNERLSALVAKAQWTSFWQWGGAPPEARSTSESASAADTAFRTRLEHDLKAAEEAEFPTDASALSSFVGQWCVEGDAAKKGSIGDVGVSMTVTNELGDASVVRALGGQQIAALAWGGVAGTLTPDRSEIDWSNGTYWARCKTAPTEERRKLAGTWYGQGLRARKCSIRQEGDRLRLDNGQGGKATGEVDSAGRVSSNWNGQVIQGTVTLDGNHINWENHTYWTRARVYEKHQ